MKIFLISNNSDSVMGFRLAGIEGIVVHSEHEFRSEVLKAVNDSSIALIMITEKLVDFCRDWIYELKFSKKAVIVQIPDRHGSKKTASDIIGGYLSDALGVNL